ncbi:hypothetical protein C5G84_02150 [Salmonella enterica]|nr:HNH endonuclease [Salmonella enterica]EEC2906527.1 hypothetical protein [Salmonella enterica]
MTNRKEIPDNVQANIMEKSAARCAICYGTRMNTDAVYPVPGFQLAHIDRNAANSAENNLALLCIPCHSMYDSTFRQAKNYRPENIRRWRDQLYEDVAANRLPPPMTYPQCAASVTQVSQSVSDHHVSLLREFLSKAGQITQVLCGDGTYLSIAIEHNRLEYIKANFSHWLTNPLRSRRGDIAALQDEFIRVLMEFASSYEYLGTLDDAPPHIIPIGYFNDIGHAIKVPEQYCCGELFHVIDVRDEWIRKTLTRLRDIYNDLDRLAME